MNFPPIHGNLLKILIIIALMANLVALSLLYLNYRDLYHYIKDYHDEEFSILTGNDIDETMLDNQKLEIEELKNATH